MSSIARRDPAVNDALLKANQRLKQLRQAHQQAHGKVGEQPAASVPDPQLPDHLGWGSARLTRILRLQQKRARCAAGGCPSAAPAQLDVEADAPADTPDQKIKLYPTIALAMLQSGTEAAGRIWLLCRALDTKGSGRLPIEQLRRQLCDKDSPLRVCGWRRMRQLLQQGAGIFWQRDDHGRLWLFATERVARNLNVERLAGNPVLLPVARLCNGMQKVRAELYASFHSGRRHNMPISREALQQISGAAPRTQRQYDQIAAVERESCIAVGAHLSQATLQQRAAQHGNATFVFVDRRGKQGPAGQRYTAWRLPNRYHPSHERAARGRQRKINHRLRTDLVNQRAQGNGTKEPRRIFFDGDQPLPASDGDSYWRAAQHNIWYVLQPHSG